MTFPRLEFSNGPAAPGARFDTIAAGTGASDFGHDIRIPSV
jgi:hypothetical protein